MNEERKKILKLLETGDITAEEAARLLEYLPGGEEVPPAREALSRRKVDPGRKLRVLVVGTDDEGNDIDVNVSIPMALARRVDDIIAHCVPEGVNEDLKRDGIDLKNLDLKGILDTVEDIDEDIVNARVRSEGHDLTVHVYVD